MQDNITGLGPTLTVEMGDVVNLALTSADGLIHSVRAPTILRIAENETSHSEGD